MHESSLIPGLVRAAVEAAQPAAGAQVRSVTIEVGVLSGISPAHLRDHFAAAAAGTVLEGADLEIRETDAGAGAATVALRSITVEGGHR